MKINKGLEGVIKDGYRIAEFTGDVFEKDPENPADSGFFIIHNGKVPFLRASHTGDTRDENNVVDGIFTGYLRDELNDLCEQIVKESDTGTGNKELGIRSVTTRGDISSGGITVRVYLDYYDTFSASKLVTLTKKGKFKFFYQRCQIIRKKGPKKEYVLIPTSPESENHPVALFEGYTKEEIAEYCGRLLTGEKGVEEKPEPQQPLVQVRKMKWTPPEPDKLQCIAYKPDGDKPILLTAENPDDLMSAIKEFYSE